MNTNKHCGNGDRGVNPSEQISIIRESWQMPMQRITKMDDYELNYLLKLAKEHHRWLAVFKIELKGRGFEFDDIYRDVLDLIRITNKFKRLIQATLNARQYLLFSVFLLFGLS